MKKAIGIGVLAVTLALFAANVAMAVDDDPVSEASTTILPTCGIKANDINFGQPTPSSFFDVFTELTLPNGNTPTTCLDIKGTDWSGPSPMSVGQTS